LAGVLWPLRLPANGSGGNERLIESGPGGRVIRLTLHDAMN